MQLRWCVICDKNGRKTEPELQYRLSVEGTWHSIPYIEFKEWEEGDKGDD